MMGMHPKQVKTPWGTAYAVTDARIRKHNQSW